MSQSEKIKFDTVVNNLITAEKNFEQLKKMLAKVSDELDKMRTKIFYIETYLGGEQHDESRRLSNKRNKDIDATVQEGEL